MIQLTKQKAGWKAGQNDNESKSRDKLKDVSLDDLNVDEGLQFRQRFDEEHVDRLTEAYASETEDVPPIQVVWDSKRYWVWDGNHRIIARTRAGFETIPARVRPGTERDAILLAAGANFDHGLPRTAADKRLAVQTLLADKTWAKRSDRWIAETCKVSRRLVADVRSEAERKAAEAETRRQQQDQRRQVAQAPPDDDGDDEDNEPFTLESEVHDVDSTSRRVGRDGKSYATPARKAEPEAIPQEPIRQQGTTKQLPPERAEVFTQAEAVSCRTLRERLVSWLTGQLREDPYLSWQLISDELAGLAVECDSWET